MNTCSPDKSRIASAILSRLSERPDAQDTMEGIAAWWLREKKSSLPSIVLKEVLADLVIQGLVERSAEDGADRYRSHRRK